MSSDSPVTKMIIEEDTYKARESEWEELNEKVYNIPESNFHINVQGASFGRSIVFEGEYFCNISVFERTQRIGVVYIGVGRDKGKELLEAELGLKLERREPLEKILSTDEMARIEEGSKKRTSGLLRI